MLDRHPAPDEHVVRVVTPRSREVLGSFSCENRSAVQARDAHQEMPGASQETRRRYHRAGASWLASGLGAVTAALLVVHLLAASSLDAAAPAPQEGESQAPAASGNVERGRYLVENVAMCGECHSTRDAAGTIVAHLRFMGGPMPVTAPRALDFPLYIPRIAGLPGYTDEQAVRLLTEGAIKRDGTNCGRQCLAIG
jgi:hypothetical protein